MAKIPVSEYSSPQVPLKEFLSSSFEYPSISSDSIKLPEIGSSFKEAQVSTPSLLQDTSSVSPATADIAAGSVQALGQTLKGIYEAKLLTERAQREAELSAGKTAGVSKFKNVQETGEAQINPLKALIANYRASVK